MTSGLSKEARELLDHMEFVGYAFLIPCSEVTELIKKGCLETEMSNWRECFDAESHITTQGIAIAKGLH